MRSLLKSIGMAAALAALAAALGSCPYQLVRERAVRLPGGAATLSAPLAQNRTIEAGLEDLFTQELIKLLVADGRVKVVDRGEAELRCVLDELTDSPASYTREGKIASELLALTGSCDLVMADSKTVALRTGPLSASEEYPVGLDYVVNEQTKEAALRQLCRDLAESVRSLLLDQAW